MVQFPMEAPRQRLQAYVRTAASLHLYSVDVRLTLETPLGAFVEPPSTLGYTPIDVTASPWRVEANGADLRALSPKATWTFTDGGVTVYGYYMVDTRGRLMFSERFDDRFDVLRPGDQLELVVMIDQRAERAT